jgi:hypothetical protein
MGDNYDPYNSQYTAEIRFKMTLTYFLSKSVQIKPKLKKFYALILRISEILYELRLESCCFKSSFGSCSKRMRVPDRLSIIGGSPTNGPSKVKLILSKYGLSWFYFYSSDCFDTYLITFYYREEIRIIFIK